MCVFYSIHCKGCMYSHYGVVVVCNYLFSVYLTYLFPFIGAAAVTFYESTAVDTSDHTDEPTVSAGAKAGIVLGILLALFVVGCAVHLFATEKKTKERDAITAANAPPDSDPQDVEVGETELSRSLDLATLGERQKSGSLDLATWRKRREIVVSE